MGVWRSMEVISGHQRFQPLLAPPPSRQNRVGTGRCCGCCVGRCDHRRQIRTQHPELPAGDVMHPHLQEASRPQLIPHIPGRNPLNQRARMRPHRITMEFRLHQMLRLARGRVAAGWISSRRARQQGQVWVSRVERPPRPTTATPHTPRLSLASISGLRCAGQQHRIARLVMYHLFGTVTGKRNPLREKPAATACWVLPMASGRPRRSHSPDPQPQSERTGTAHAAAGLHVWVVGDGEG
jgi:hypothetical protein